MSFSSPLLSVITDADLERYPVYAKPLSQKLATAFRDFGGGGFYIEPQGDWKVVHEEVSKGKDSWNSYTHTGVGIVGGVKVNLVVYAYKEVLSFNQPFSLPQEIARIKEMLPATPPDSDLDLS